MRILLKDFFRLESSSGIILFLMAVLAMIWANSPLAYLHQELITASLFWVNEGLMAIFFLIVGLELKRGFLEGELSRVSQVILPAIAAVGGMAIPALIYYYINYDNAVALRGWATPVATDIAFALGVLSLFGKRIPTGLKLFLLALAIFDDLGAIVIIALFYSHGFEPYYLLATAGLFAVLCLMNHFSVRYLVLYLLIGALLWFCMLHSGVHPTIAGVLVAFTIPANRNQSISLLHRLEAALHPWVAYLIMPLFALVNAGFSLKGLTIENITDTIVLGIAAGLFLGKQIGVFGFSWAIIKLGWAKKPDRSTWLMLYGVSLLCGIGFTMSLFLGTLSFQQSGVYLAEMRLGVMTGSILSGLVGAFVLLSAVSSRGVKQ